MQDATGKSLVQALFADSTRTQEVALRAEQPVVVQRLHDWDACLAACRINGLRNHDECVMYVYQVWSLSPDQLSNLRIGIIRPDSLLQQSQTPNARIFFNFTVASHVEHNPVTMPA